MDYIPQVGDRVKLANAPAGQWFDVTYVGQRVFVGIDENGLEQAEQLSLPWTKVEPPVVWPATSAFVYASGLVSSVEVGGQVTVGTVTINTDGAAETVPAAP